MVDRQQSSRNLLSEEEKGFDHGITALLLIFFGVCSAVLGATMTGLAYGYQFNTFKINKLLIKRFYSYNYLLITIAYEKREHFTSVAEGYGFAF